MTKQTSEIEEALKYVQDFIDCIDEEGLDRENNQRHYRTVLKLARQAEILKYTLQIARRDIKNWITNEEARDAAISFIDKKIAAAEELK